MAERRCEARTMYRGTGPVTHEIRCDLHAGHAGAHELRSRSGGGVVTTWSNRGDSADVIRRVDRYTVMVEDHPVRADPGTEAQLAAMTAEQRARFLTIMGARPTTTKET